MIRTLTVLIRTRKMHVVRLRWKFTLPWAKNSPSCWALTVNSFMPFAVYHALLTTPLTACKNRLITQTIADTSNFRPTVTKCSWTLNRADLWLSCISSQTLLCGKQPQKQLPQPELPQPRLFFSLRRIFKTFESESGRTNPNNGTPRQDKAYSQRQVACTFCTQMWCSYSPCQHGHYRAF